MMIHSSCLFVLFVVKFLLPPFHNRHFLLGQAVQLIYEPVDLVARGGELGFELLEDVRGLLRRLLLV